MSRHKITDGLHQRADGRWERKEKINGKMRWFSSMEPAEVWKKRDAAIAAGPEEKAKENAGPTFDEVANMYESAVCDMKYGTQKVYLPAIRRAKERFGNRRIKEIEPYEIAEFLKSLSSLARTTVLNQKTVLNAIFQTWISSPKWHGDHNAAELVTVPHGLRKGKREPPTTDQVKIVKDHHMDPDALPAVVYLCTGERKGEACGIQMKDIDFETGTIHITKHIELQGNKPHMLDGAKTPAGVRKIPLLQMLREALEPLRSKSPETYILGGRQKPLSGSQYNRMWVSFWRKYGMAHSRETTEKHLRNGVPKITKRTVWTADVCAHQFRHEYVCMLAEAEIPEAIAIQIVGHANAKMIHEVYMSLKPEMVEDTRKKLDALIATPAK
jgi:integrase